MTTGERICEAMARRGWTYRDAAKAIGISVSDVWRLANDQIDPRVSTAMKVAAGLGMSTDELFGGLQADLERARLAVENELMREQLAEIRRVLEPEARGD